MRSLFLHLSVTCVTFFFGWGSATLLKPVPRITETVPAEPVQLATLENTDEQAIREVYREYGPAQTRQDRAFFERVESDRFILFVLDRNLTREQDIREMESRPRDTVYECEVESIRFVGDGAVVNTLMHARSNGEVDSYRSVDVWINDGEGWKILSTTSME